MISDRGSNTPDVTHSRCFSATRHRVAIAVGGRCGSDVTSADPSLVSTWKIGGRACVCVAIMFYSPESEADARKDIGVGVVRVVVVVGYRYRQDLLPLP